MPTASFLSYAFVNMDSNPAARAAGAASAALSVLRPIICRRRCALLNVSTRYSTSARVVSYIIIARQCCSVSWAAFHLPSSKHPFYLPVSSARHPRYTLWSCAKSVLRAGKTEAKFPDRHAAPASHMRWQCHSCLAIKIGAQEEEMPRRRVWRRHGLLGGA